MKVLIGLLVVSMFALSGCKTMKCGKGEAKTADKPAVEKAEKVEKAEAKAEKAEKTVKAEKAKTAEKAEKAAKVAKMEMVAVESSTIDKIGYDAEKEVLKIEFKGGEAYKYMGVPKTLHARLMKAKSKGEFFHDNIKDKFETKKCD